MWPYVRPEIKKTFIEPERLKQLNVKYKNLVHEILYTSQTLPKRILVSDAGNQNPYHVLVFTISRFYFFDKGEDIIFYYQSPEKSYIVEEVFKHLPKRFTREESMDPNYEYVEMPGCLWFHFNMEAWIYPYLRDLFKEVWQNTPQEKGKYTYISRNPKDIQNRRCLNEDELILPLKEIGFSSYNLNTLTFEQQIKLFRSSEVIAGIHGAGLTWLMFCFPKTRVVEIQHKSWSSCREYYADLCKKCNLVYFRFLGVEQFTENSVEHPDVIINKNSFIESLKHVVSLP